MRNIQCEMGSLIEMNAQRIITQNFTELFSEFQPLYLAVRPAA